MIIFPRGEKCYPARMIRPFLKRAVEFIWFASVVAFVAWGYFAAGKAAFDLARQLF